MKEIDITKHAMVPKHIILGEKEREELFKTYGITPRHLPRILESDPVVVAIQAKIGDVLRIVRKSQTAGTVNYYRIVVKG
jgi:DNA-directed RNA polymerase subunit H